MSKRKKKSMSCFSRKQRRKKMNESPLSSIANEQAPSDANPNVDNTILCDEKPSIVEKPPPIIECMICYDTENNEGLPEKMGCCEGIAHESCLRNHFRPECPFCRRELKEKDGASFTVHGSVPEPPFPFPNIRFITYPPLTNEPIPSSILVSFLLGILMEDAHERGILHDVVENNIDNVSSSSSSITSLVSRYYDSDDREQSE